MKTWTIGKRISLGFASIILISLVLGGYAHVRLARIREQANYIASQTSVTVQLCNFMGVKVRDNVQAVYKHVGSSDKEDMARLEAQISAAGDANTRAMEQIGQINSGERYRQPLEQIKSTRAEHAKARNAVLAVSRQGTNNAAAYDLARSQLEPATEHYLAALDALMQVSQNESDQATKGIQAAVQSSQTAIVLGLGLALLVGVTVAFLIVRDTGRSLHKIATALTDGSDQVASASTQVSSSSQSLAEGASEQAASLEETSSSLEEMASMTRRNAENSQKANALAKETRSAAEAGVSEMQQMTKAMEAIQVSSDDIAKIIKTIDEIAFQTNILALNAAVEAARAGEAGMGFAVVADEVRNLAQRCAQAAKETSVKIEGAISTTTQGVELSVKVAKALDEIVKQAQKMHELVAEVDSASHEQSQGIDQVNTALSEMDKVVQSNAASAEETASASEELSAQAEAMKGTVSELLALVGKSRAAGSAVSSGTALTSHRGSVAPLAPKHAPSVSANGHSRKKEAPVPAVVEPVHPRPVRNGSARAAIPLETAFKDF